MFTAVSGLSVTRAAKSNQVGVPVVSLIIVNMVDREGITALPLTAFSASEVVPLANLILQILIELVGVGVVCKTTTPIGTFLPPSVTSCHMVFARTTPGTELA